MTINYPKIIFLNLIIVIPAFIFFSADTKAGLSGGFFLGLVLSFFFKENLFERYLKLMFLNSLFFFLLSIPIVYLNWVIIDIMGKGNPDSLASISGSAGFALGETIFYSFGYFAGIIPQSIRERFSKQERVNLSDRSLQNSN